MTDASCRSQCMQWKLTKSWPGRGQLAIGALACEHQELRLSERACFYSGKPRIANMFGDIECGCDKMFHSYRGRERTTCYPLQRTCVCKKWYGMLTSPSIDQFEFSISDQPLIYSTTKYGEHSFLDLRIDNECALKTPAASPPDRKSGIRRI